VVLLQWEGTTKSLENLCSLSTPDNLSTYEKLKRPNNLVYSRKVFTGVLRDSSSSNMFVNDFVAYTRSCKCTHEEP
jgi:hypothetical protein